MSLREIIFLNRDNDIVIALANNGVTINHSTLTRVQLYVGDYLCDSSTMPNSFDFTSPSKIVISLGTQNIPVGKYKSRLYAYDLDNELGIAWGDLLVIVKY
jgi:hypothetical protein